MSEQLTIRTWMNEYPGGSNIEVSSAVDLDQPLKKVYWAVNDKGGLQGVCGGRILMDFVFASGLRRNAVLVYDDGEGEHWDYLRRTGALPAASCRPHPKLTIKQTA